ncbi:hypothetical protein TcasGA2_TC008259 [Tribolium castaneum]|uniref:Uncharacterized protein n=1 Tax=Tribolium castaneum TaxID=7070 RepID=D2A0R8_TRICA|nr:hypothetical protein TcasGA2_TC008259 [Tribolium castaneum]
MGKKFALLLTPQRNMHIINDNVNYSDKTVREINPLGPIEKSSRSGTDIVGKFPKQSFNRSELMKLTSLPNGINLNPYWNRRLWKKYAGSGEKLR